MYKVHSGINHVPGPDSGVAVWWSERWLFMENHVSGGVQANYYLPIKYPGYK